jgi:HSP20 family molecular chaperone IbpA
MDEPSAMHMQQWMPIKLYRTPDRVVIAAPMPGVRPEDVTVDVTETGRVILQSTPLGAEIFARVVDEIGRSHAASSWFSRSVSLPPVASARTSATRWGALTHRQRNWAASSSL